MCASEQRQKHAFGKNDPVAVAVVHSRDKEPLTERIQDCAEDRDRRLTPNEAAVELDRVLRRS